MTNPEFSTKDTILETADLPTIKHGGVSSSAALNKINEAVRSDISTISQRLSTVEDSLDEAAGLVQVQASALSAQAVSLSASIADAIAALALKNSAIIDMYSTSYISEDTTADINTVYGQATLRIRNSEDKLVSVDSEGGVWVPDAAKIKYLYSAHSDPRPEEKSEYMQADGYVKSLDRREDTAWTMTRTSPLTQEDIWVLVEVPIETLTYAYANTIVIHPFPLFVHGLSEVWYQDYDGTWHEVDKSYCPGYNQSTGTIDNFGCTRLFFEPTYVAALLFRIDADHSQAMWGFSKIELKMTDFASSSVIKANLASLAPAGSTLSKASTLLTGKNLAELSQISPTISGKTIEYELVQNISGMSPVITSIQTKWTN